MSILQIRDSDKPWAFPENKKSRRCVDLFAIVASEQVTHIDTR